MKVNIGEYKGANGNRVVDVIVESFDIFNADNTIGLVIHPILVAYKEKSKGYFHVDDEDVPDELKVGKPVNGFRNERFHPDNGDFDSGKKKHDWVIDEMIYAFDCIGPNSDWEDEYYIFKDGYDTAPFEQMNLFYEVDNEGIDAAQKRIDNGMRLFGKYYRGLWI